MRGFGDGPFRKRPLHPPAAPAGAAAAGCNFFDSVITGCRLTGSTFDRCAFSGTEVTGGDWSVAQMLGADLTTAEFRNVRMNNSNLSGARCHGGVISEHGQRHRALGETMREWRQ